ncbi:group II intron reverse transcriptase/maturase [Solitalea lacus]|uniref:group II intron reverse transcriptase/maturase n=1 Tax=Solitalea lacus TaxID=2911172 RepID=UPI001EDADA4B|nr:group II intron reverse transcriptase/maturase [Solitalea lacus]UKJ06074.1 group II intron reverse transcriptase/maturase [Solitalea lacus]
MNGRKQKTEQDTWQSGNRSETESGSGGQTYLWMTEKGNTNTTQGQQAQLLEYILSPSNLNAAYKQVKRNNGTGGVDGMNVEKLLPYLQSHREELLDSLQNGRYKPQAVRRVEISKENGKKRALGIPTVVERVIQQAITQQLTPIYERQFSPNSYGFRPKRSAHQAIKQCQTNANDGYRYVVDMDLEKFFDTVNQSKLIEILSRTIPDGRVVSLIHKYLKAGVMIQGEFQETSMGVPQGGNLSPLLSNVMLNELDKELKERGHRFVRYADDCMVFCKSRRAAERVLVSLTNYIEQKLYLKVNREKTTVAHVKDVKFLGYGFYFNKNGCKMRTHKKSVEKMKDKIRELTSRSNGWGNERRKEAIRRYITGWLNYFQLADMKGLLERIDEWYRRRIRSLIWKQWKSIKTRIRNLIKLGIPKNKAMEYGNTRKSYWRTANSQILSRSITNERLKQSGYLFFADYYQKLRCVN